MILIMILTIIILLLYLIMILIIIILVYLLKRTFFTQRNIKPLSYDWHTNNNTQDP